MRIGITGAPASGKTTLADELGKITGWKVIHLTEFILKKKLARGYDKRLEAKIVDVEKVEKELLDRLPENAIIEGHLLVEMSLPLDVLVVLQEDPLTLLKRMEERGYNEDKIEENLVAYHLDYFWEKGKAKKKLRFKPLDDPRESALVLLELLGIRQH